MAEKFDASLLAWLKRVMETQEDEINCAECQDLVSQYVHLELDTGEAAARIPQLAHHLNQCPACWDTYRVLLELARLEEQGRLPTVQKLIEWLKSDE